MDDHQEMKSIVISNENLARKLGQELCDHLKNLKNPVKFTWEYFSQ